MVAKEIFILFINAVILTMLIPGGAILCALILEMFWKLVSTALGIPFMKFLHTWATFVGVIHHELSHALMAVITGAKVESMQIFTPKEKEKVGSVKVELQGNRIQKAVQATLIALAPVILGSLTMTGLLMWIVKFQDTMPGWKQGILYYIVISIGLHLSLSETDRKSMWRGLPIIGVVVFLLCLFFRIQFPFQIGDSPFL